MVLVLTVPNGAAGVQVALDSPATGEFLSPVVDIFGVPDPAFGQQTAWAINPGTGSDSGPGTPAAPLRTMAEFSRRYASLLVTVAATLQLVGDVIDSPLWLRGTAFAAGASLNVLGTRTVLASATVTTVTQLGDLGVGFPFNFLTAGIDWTTFPIGAQVRMTVSGAMARIMSVTDANNAVLGPFLTAAGANTIPANGDAFTVESISRAQPPIVNATGQSTGAGNAAPSLTVDDCSFDGNLSQSYSGGMNVRIRGCEIMGGSASRELVTSLSVQWQSCRWTLPTASFRMRIGSGVIQDINGCVIAGNTFILQGYASLLRVGFNASKLQVNQGSSILIGPINHRNTNGPITVEEGSRINGQGAQACAAGSTGNTGVGIDCPRGAFSWQGAAAKPTVTGSTPGTNDVRIGGVAMGYVALGLGYYAIFNNANPNSILNLVGAAQGGGSWMAQS